jgi:hypothetical protein
MNGGGNQLQDIELLIQSRPLDRLADSHNLDATQVLQKGAVQIGQETQWHAYRAIVIQPDRQAPSGVVPHGGCERLTAPSLRTPPRGRRKSLSNSFSLRGSVMGESCAIRPTRTVGEPPRSRVLAGRRLSASRCFLGCLSEQGAIHRYVRRAFLCVLRKQMLFKLLSSLVVRQIHPDFCGKQLHKQRGRAEVRVFDRGSSDHISLGSLVPKSVRCSFARFSQQFDSGVVSHPQRFGPLPTNLIAIEQDDRRVQQADFAGQIADTDCGSQFGNIRV